MAPAAARGWLCSVSDDELLISSGHQPHLRCSVAAWGSRLSWWTLRMQNVHRSRTFSSTAPV